MRLRQRRVVHRWQQAIDEGDPGVEQSMDEELRSIAEPVAAESLVAIIHERGRSKRLPEKETGAYRQLSLKLIAILDSIRDDWAIHSLVRHAVFHPLPEARTAAADALGNREMKRYVPLLLSGMQSPIEASFAIRVYPGGSVGYYETFYREGVEAGLRETRSGLVRLEGVGGRFYREGELNAIQAMQAQSNTKRFVKRSLLAQSRAAATAAESQDQVERANAAIAELNERIQLALGRATGVSLPADARYWWEWWRERWYDDYELEKPDRSPGYGARQAIRRTCRLAVTVLRVLRVATEILRVSESRAQFAKAPGPRIQGTLANCAKLTRRILTSHLSELRWNLTSIQPILVNPLFPSRIPTRV